MKRCPTCHQSYTDATLRFCLDDGAPLIEDTTPPFDSAATLIAPSSPDIHQTPGSYRPTPDPRTQQNPWHAPTNPVYGAPTLPGYPSGQLPPPRKSSLLPWVVGGVLVFLLGAVVIGGLVVWSMLRNSTSSSSTSPPPRTQKDVVVSKLGGGQYTTITEAIKNAPAGARINVKPGVYNESINISRDVEIVGDGPIAQIIVEAVDAEALTVVSNKALVRGLTLRNRVTGKDKKFFAVTVSEGGELKLEDCDVTSSSLTGVGAYGAGTKAFIRRTRVHDCAESGIYFYKGSSGVIEDCDVFNSGYANISIKEGGDPNITKSRIYNSKSSGVYVYLNGKGTIEDSRIYGNAYSGISTSEGGDPFVNRCKINNNGYNAIYSTKSGKGTVQNSDLTGNTKGPTDIDSSSTVRMSGNTQ
jgi:hypothetical protein